MAIEVLQWVGSGAVLLSTTALGRKKADQYRNRPRDLRRLAASLRALEADIQYARVPLQEALERAGRQVAASDSPVATLFHEAAAHLQNPGVTAQQAWERAVDEKFGSTSLSCEDREILLQLGKHIGQTGPDEQVGHLEAALALLDAREREAIDDRQRFERLYQTVGVLAGVLLVIFFI